MTSTLNPDAAGSRSGIPGIGASSEAVWSSRTQWGAIVAGAFAGILVVILMGTLGVALGITVGAVGFGNAEPSAAGLTEKAGTAFTVGAATWFLLTALITGLVAGWVLNATSRRDRPYSSFIFGGLTWAVGTCVMMLVASPGIGGVLSGIERGGGGTLGGFINRPAFPGSAQKQASTPPAARAEQAAPPAGATMTEEERSSAKETAEKVTSAATGAAWVILGAQLISIAATMFAAGWNRHTGARVVTEIRPRPIPTA